MPTRKVSLPNSLAFSRPPLACLKYRLDPAPGLLPAAHFLRLPQAWNSAGGHRCNQVMLRKSCRPGSAPAHSGWPPPRGCWPGDLSDPSWRCLTVANLKRFRNWGQSKTLPVAYTEKEEQRRKLTPTVMTASFKNWNMFTEKLALLKYCLLKLIGESSAFTTQKEIQVFV